MSSVILISTIAHKAAKLDNFYFSCNFYFSSRS